MAGRKKKSAVKAEPKRRVHGIGIDGERLRAVRLERKMSQWEFSVLVEIQPAQLSSIECGKRAVSDATLKHTGNFRKWLLDLLISAGISRRDATGRVVHIHALRHTFVTRLARAGVSVPQAQVLSGHRSAQLVTRIYTHLATADVRNIVDRLLLLGSARNSANDARLNRPAQNSLYTD